MKFKKILLLKYTGNELQSKYWEQMDTLCEEKVMVLPDDPALDTHLKDADCLLVRLGAKVGKEIINKAPKLKYIGMLGTGYGGIDTSYAASKNITVCNIADYATEAVSEFAFSLILECIRDIEKAKRQAKEGDYSDDFIGSEIKGKNFGVIGLGNIGSRTAEIAKGFGANVQYWSRRRKNNYEKMGIQFQNVTTLLQSSDFISINLAFTPDTENFLNKERIEMIKKDAIVINLSPMELIDLDALVVRLKQGNITFILDHPDEMTSEQLDKVKPYSNCIVYPPIGYLTKEAADLKQGIFVGNMKNFLTGSPTNKVN